MTNQGAALPIAGDPFLGERQVEQCGADGAAEVGAALAPVETGEREPAAEAAGGLDVHA